MPNEADALMGELSPPARPPSKSRLTSTVAFVCVLVVVAVLSAHYVWWSSSNYPGRLNEHDFQYDRPGSDFGRRPVDADDVAGGTRDQWNGDEPPEEDGEVDVKDDGETEVNELPEEDGETEVKEPPEEDGETEVKEPPEEDGETEVKEPAEEDGETEVKKPAEGDGETEVKEPAEEDGETEVKEPAEEDGETEVKEEHPDLSEEQPLEKERKDGSRADDQIDSEGGTAPATSANNKENRTCDSNKYAFNANGKPCMDLKTSMYRQLIYVTAGPDVQYLYCAIPKNGCTYHLALLNRIQGVEDYESQTVIHDRDRKDIFTLYARDSKTIGRMLVNESLPKYMVIRNPLRRTLSAYLDKVQRNLPKDERTVEAFHEWIYEEFPKGAPLDRSWVSMNPHWRPELEFCGYKIRDVQSVFKVFRVEDPEPYVDFLYSIVPEKYLKDGWGGKDNLNFRDHVLGPRKRTGNTDEKFERYFNNLELFDHMSRVLQNDIKVLGYEEEVAELRENLKRNLGML